MNDINALCRIGMTGTAIQNKYEELWTLLNWTNPGRLGPISIWKQAICLPLTFGQSHDATVSQLGTARRTAERLVKNLLPTFFLRRTKALIAHQLPKKSDRVVFCPLTETQGEAYNNFCDSEIVRTCFSVLTSAPVELSELRVLKRRYTVLAATWAQPEVNSMSVALVITALGGGTPVGSGASPQKYSIESWT